MKERFISAIIMFIIFVPILIIGKLPFIITSLILSLIAIYELLKLKKNIPFIIKFIVYLFITLIFLLNLDKYFAILMFLIILTYLSMLVFINDQEKYNYKDAFSIIGMTIFIGISFKNFIIIRNNNLSLFIYLFLISIVTDTFALLIGKKIGKHKLASKISPNKTIEGSIGGSLFGTAIASLFYFYFINNQHIIRIIFLTFFLTVVGQIGDLIKSSIKRSESIKDFGNLIPGHGGILDRFDSIIFIIMTYILATNLI